MRPSNNKRFPTSDNYNDLTRKEHRALLYLNSSNQMVVVWLQQLKPEWCQLAQKICRACPILWGGPGQSPGTCRVPCFHICTCSFFLKYVFLVFAFSIRLFSPVRHLRRAQVLYRDPVALPGNTFLYRAGAPCVQLGTVLPFAILCMTSSP